MAEGDETKSSDNNTPAEETEEPITLDLGIDPAKTYERNDNVEEVCEASAGIIMSPLTTTDHPTRREDNPFSFKHFLRHDLTYQSQGARPKVYCEGRPIMSVSDLDLNHAQLADKSTRIEMTTMVAGGGLPDFVQDHLVLEQQLGSGVMSDNSVLPDVFGGGTVKDNKRPQVEFPLDLPQQVLDRDQRSSAVHPECFLGGSGVLSDSVGGGVLPDVFGGGNVERQHDGGLNRVNDWQIPLELPVRPQAEFPLDLPQQQDRVRDQRNSSLNAEVGVSNSLPDFLTDGAVRNTNTTTSQQSLDGHVTTSPVLADHHVTGDRPETSELDAYRRQLVAQSRQIAQLTGELEAVRANENDYVKRLTKELGQLTESLDRSNYRAATAESTVTQLRQEIKALNLQVNLLQRDNITLLKGNCDGASSGSSSNRSQSVDLQAQRFAQELRGAAATAERSLRQLLSGTDNLRIMASYIETSFTGEESHYRPDNEEDNAGPAL